MQADNSRFLAEAAQRRSQATRERAIRALRRLVASGAPITFDSLARSAGVSRSWLYAQPDLRLEVGRLRAQQRERQGLPDSPPIPARQRASDASLRRRLEATNAEIHRLRQENQQLREQLAWALGERRAADVRGQPNGGRNRERAASTTIGPCS
jgi:Family of unknown function (DUF6262)